jgi:FixJ family two-component response regulator
MALFGEIAMADSVSTRTVIVIDDDPEMCEAITLMLKSVGLCVESFACAEDFLKIPFRHEAPKCLVLDVRMRGLSGLGLQKRLTQQGVWIPIIFLTGYGDVSTAVQAIRSGGFDFLEKPLHRDMFLERIGSALDLDAQLLLEDKSATIEKRIESLSRREREGYSLLIEGRSNKEIARILEIGMPTVTKHRTRVLHKMGVRNFFELANLKARSHSLGQQSGSDALNAKHSTSASNDPQGGPQSSPLS